MEMILVSACLLGRPVRYDGSDKRSDFRDILNRWQADGRVVPVCPEVSAGLPIPRPAAEITGGISPVQGADVMAGTARVIDVNGRDITQSFTDAALHTVALAKRHGCRHAVLTDGSPSCGSTFIYDGTFSGTRRNGAGTTAAALMAQGIRVWPQSEIAHLDAMLRAKQASAD